MTEAWSINAGYQHIWGLAGTFGGKWKTSVYGGYVSINITPADEEQFTNLLSVRL